MLIDYTRHHTYIGEKVKKWADVEFFFGYHSYIEMKVKRRNPFGFPDLLHKDFKLFDDESPLGFATHMGVNFIT